MSMQNDGYKGSIRTICTNTPNKTNYKTIYILKKLFSTFLKKPVDNCTSL